MLDWWRMWANDRNEREGKDRMVKNEKKSRSNRWRKQGMKSKLLQKKPKIFVQILRKEKGAKM